MRQAQFHRLALAAGHTFEQFEPGGHEPRGAILNAGIGTDQQRLISIKQPLAGGEGFRKHRDFKQPRLISQLNKGKTVALFGLADLFCRHHPGQIDPAPVALAGDFSFNFSRGDHLKTGELLGEIIKRMRRDIKPEGIQLIIQFLPADHLMHHGQFQRKTMAATVTAKQVGLGAFLFAPQ